MFVFKKNNNLIKIKFVYYLKNDLDNFFKKKLS